ncbi:uncharacterized protein N7477_009758 [Penicillium maclennaniae]|uniref:uncharacterized protein n=1 Tax=Penicillium maclennaniae TaxID=1343394 RepID=UPI002540F36E|nr:uncharacterized protein N7477_009758 [Penicillium maclennaniae]KAJ5662142.1 hypothetical protein N7477_009758 [Penicillium maclennaniae]
MAAPQKDPSLKQAMGNKILADTVVTTSPSAEMNIEVCPFIAFHVPEDSPAHHPKVNTSQASSIRPTHGQYEGTNSETSIPPASQPPIRPSNRYRVSKPRQQYQKDDGPARKHSFPGKPGSNPPSEEKLFELLIRRIRQREEQETATVELQCLMEEQNLRLKDENEILKQQLEANHEKLQKSVAESKDRRAQMDHWKEKLRKFKEVVNDLGKEHEILRDESNKFKATIESLDKEKSGLLHSIDGIRVQTARAEGIIDEQKLQLSESETRAAVLRQSLESAKDLRDLSQSELAKEKKRSATLELYVQNYARSQTRQLILIREDQRKLIESVSSGIQSLSAESNASKDALLSEVRTCADQLCTWVETLSDKCTAERMEVQDFTNTVHDAVSR